MQDFLDNAEPRVIAMLLIGIVLLAIAAEASVFLIPQVKTYRELNASYGALNQAASSGESILQQLEKSTLEVDQLSRELHGDMARLPEKQMESFIIGRLQNVSWKSEVELLSVKPGSGKQVQNFREILFDVRLASSYANFFEWLQVVNDELGFIVVKVFEIDPRAQRDQSEPVLDIALTLVSYRVIADGT